MPKETFLNLSDEKRQRIIQASYDEFINSSYEEATIRRIVNNAEIPVGSFYQYFEGKDDLYLYLVDLILDKINKYREQNFSFLELINSEKELDLENVLTVKEFKFTNTFYHIPDDLLKKFYFEHRAFLQNSVKDMLNDLKEKELLNNNVDIEYISYILGTIQFNIYMYHKVHSLSMDNIGKETENLISNIFINGLLKR